MINNLSKREKLLTGTAIILLLIFLLTTTVLLPQFQSYNKTVGELQNARARLAGYKALLSSMEEEEKELEIINKEISALESIFYINKPGEKMISDIVAQAQEENISLMYIQALAAVSNNNYFSEIPVKINAGGEYESIFNFISSLEGLNKDKVAPDIRELSIFTCDESQLEGESFLEPVEAQITLSFYVLKVHEPPVHTEE